MSPPAAAALEAVGLSKAYGGVRAVDDVSLEIGASEFLGLVGPSGCGKTTTLRMLAGLEGPDKGRVLIGGEDATDTPARSRDTNIVFQDLVLFPHMTVAENVAYGLARDGVGGAARRTRVEDALELVSLPGFGDRDPSALSGGQQQRVALARALVNDPAVLLLDEPLSSLDRALREEMRTELKRIQRESETAFLYVTHDQESAMSMSDRIGVMCEGRIVDVGPPDRLYTRPRTRFVAEFLGDAATFRGEVRSLEGDRATVETAIGPIDAAAGATRLSVGQRATVVVRPEAVSLGSGPFSGTVRETAYKGFYRQVTIDTDGERLSARTSAEGDGGVEASEQAQPTADGGPAATPALTPGESVRYRIDRAVVLDDVDE